MSTSSAQWKGGAPQRFKGNRKHMQMPNELGPGLVPNHYPKVQSLNVFTSNPNPTPQYQHRSTLKTFADKYISDQKQIDPKGKKPLVLAQQPQRRRPQRLHNIDHRGLQTDKQLQMRGLRTFRHSYSLTKNRYDLQEKLQRKARVLGLQGQRNDIGVNALGDKAYKYPEYAPDFYKAGGLIAGSSNKFSSTLKQLDGGLDEKMLKGIFTKPHWKDKVKMDEKVEEKQVVESVDQWEKTILKENNPKYQDPDTFFERMQASKETGGGKDKKAVGKK